MLQAESSGQTELTASRSCPGMRSLSLSLGLRKYLQRWGDNCNLVFARERK